jgi:hypothetical protein
LVEPGKIRFPALEWKGVAGMSLSQVKISRAVVTNIISLGVGLALGIAGSAILAPVPRTYLRDDESKTLERISGFYKGLAPKKEQERSANDLLVSLVAKLDHLSAQPGKLSMSKEERQKVLQQLQDLGDVKTLSGDDAKKRVDALLDVLKEYREILVAADFPWPGSPRLHNPFVEEENRAHLNALRARLEK